MYKIQTIFKRRRTLKKKEILNEYVYPALGADLYMSYEATEKLDGTNIRLTIRNNMVVRVEKRRNPTKREKEQGIIEPWYKDADQSDNADSYLFASAANTDLTNIPDGEFSAEAVGPKIQGNPLNLTSHKAFLLDYHVPIIKNVPVELEELREWLPKQTSKIGNNCGIEGIVWRLKGKHRFVNKKYKIKLKDLK